MLLILKRVILIRVLGEFVRIVFSGVDIVQVMTKVKHLSRVGLSSQPCTHPSPTQKGCNIEEN